MGFAAIALLCSACRFEACVHTYPLLEQGHTCPPLIWHMYEYTSILPGRGHSQVNPSRPHFGELHSPHRGLGIERTTNAAVHVAALLGVAPAKAPRLSRLISAAPARGAWPAPGGCPGSWLFWPPCMDGGCWLVGSGVADVRPQGGGCCMTPPPIGSGMQLRNKAPRRDARGAWP